MAMVNEEQFRSLQTQLDQFFLIVMGMIVYLMQCGFAFLEAGSVRSKNSTNILIKNLLDSFVAGVAYWVFGFAFAFGSGNNFIGYDHFALARLPEVSFASFFFQYVFAATAATIVSGALAERCEFAAYFVYSFLITSFIYPVVTHWVWSDEAWLTAGMEYTINNQTVTIGYRDFAGSGVVHMVGGVAAFMGAAIIGPRLGRFHSESNTALELRGHSVPFAALGGFILLFGFMAFNGGSELSISGASSGANVSRAVVNTIIAGSVSAFFTLLLQKTGIFGNSRWSLLSTLNGALTGMVAVCAGCNVYYPWGAAILGFFAAIVYKFFSWLMVKIKVDDPLDAVAVHFGGGLWGVIAVAFLNIQNGIVFSGNKESGLQLAWLLAGVATITVWTGVLSLVMFGSMRLAGILRVSEEMERAINSQRRRPQLAWQLAGVATITVWTGVLSLVMFGGMRLAGILRVSEEMERKGLDIPKHGEPAYPLESYGHGHIEKIVKMLESGQLQSVFQGNTGMENGGYKVDDDDDDEGTRKVSGNGTGTVVQPGYESPEVDVLQNGSMGGYVHYKEDREENTAL